MTAPQSPPVYEMSTAAPRLRDDLVFSPDRSDGEPGYLIDDPIRSKFFRVGRPEFLVMSMLDGQTPLSEVVGTTARQLGPSALDEQQALQLVDWMASSGLLADAEIDTEEDSEPRSESVSKRLQRLLAVKLPLINPDSLLNHWSPWCQWLLGPHVFAVWCATLAIALCVLAINWQRFMASTAVILQPGTWFLLVPAWLVLKLCHEFFHALACKKYGGRVTRAGIMLLLLAPVAFVDVTSAWRFRDRRSRVITAAAGMYLELFVASLALILWSMLESGPIERLAYAIALMASVHTIMINGNPLLRFDGYFILSDLLDVPNLYARGQAYLAYVVQRYLLAADVSPPRLPQRRARFVKIYAVAAIAWRLVLYGALTLTLVATLGGFGAFIAAGVIALGLVLPTVDSLVRWWRAGIFRLTRRSMSRLAIAGTMAATLGVLGLMPARFEAAGVVEYAPLVTIRAGATGFVRGVSVTSGQTVKQGDVIAVLENDELKTELDEVRLALEQSTLRSRAYNRRQEMAKFQAEMAQVEALTSKQHELQARVDSLTVRAPITGQVEGRELPRLTGQFLDSGTELAIVSGARTKELLLAVDEEDLKAFQNQLGRPVRVSVVGVGDLAAACRLDRVEPRAAGRLPHPALSTQCGGPIPVKLVQKADGTQVAETLAPVFSAAVSIPAADAANLRAGQEVRVSFRSREQNLVSRWAVALRRWLRRQMESRAQGA